MKAQSTINITNKRAVYNYFITASYEAGIMLTGTEIKSIREGKANLTDAFCIFKFDELWIRNLHISEYKEGSYNNHEPKRERKLLLNKTELRKLQSKIKEKGTTIIPVKMYISNRGFAKLEIGLARGKKTFDKRESLKKAEATREMSRIRKEYVS